MLLKILDLDLSNFVSLSLFSSLGIRRHKDAIAKGIKHLSKKEKIYLIQDRGEMQHENVFVISSFF